MVWASKVITQAIIQAAPLAQVPTNIDIGALQMKSRKVKSMWATVDIKFAFKTMQVMFCPEMYHQ